ncbi:hypothetical protein DRP05_07650 [Archaeoglobales archaeon]|nr:MAG: hypothetical protein DRP05_07650 [Archaeoglobales archaeon]
MGCHEGYYWQFVSHLNFLICGSGIVNLVYMIIYNSYNMILILITVLFFVLFIIYYFRTYFKVYIYDGREDAMMANVELLKIKEPRDATHKYILSTRFSLWLSSEVSRPRTEFRSLLTEKIKNGIEVKRIWQIRNEEDLKKLSSYLEQYKNYDNISIKYLVGKSSLPEILCVYGKVASISIPQDTDPYKMVTAIHFYNKRVIKRLEKYFNAIWEIATP